MEHPSALPPTAVASSVSLSQTDSTRKSEVSAPRTHNLPVVTEIPAGVQLVGVIGYAGIFGAMWVTFGGYDAWFVLAISTFFAAVFFAVPAIMFRTAKSHGFSQPAPTMSDFLAGDLETWTGRIKGREALVQVAAVPIALALGSFALAVIVITAR